MGLANKLLNQCREEVMRLSSEMLLMHQVRTPDGLP